MNVLRRSFLATALAVVLSVAVTNTSFALDVPPAPADVPVVDQTKTLTAEQITDLAKQIKTERDESGNQIAVLMIASLDGETKEDYALAVARKWGIGTKQNNNGVLLLIAKNDRQFRIEVGTGLEGTLTDVQSSRILRNDIAPKFREANYYEGIKVGLEKIIASIHGEYVASETTATPSVSSLPWELILGLGFMFFSWIGSILGRTKSWWAGGVIGALSGGLVGIIASSLLFGLLGAIGLGIAGLLFDKAVSRNYKSHVRDGQTPSWWAGGGFMGGGPSGGFGGFGGGGFGGGGAGGDW